ncbi:hypothetical protein D3C81_1615320 [compost metagenome]
MAEDWVTGVADGMGKGISGFGCCGVALGGLERTVRAGVDASLVFGLGAGDRTAPSTLPESNPSAWNVAACFFPTTSLVLSVCLK